jgi:hypothetical protein
MRIRQQLSLDFDSPPEVVIDGPADAFVLHASPPDSIAHVMLDVMAMEPGA